MIYKAVAAEVKRILTVGTHIGNIRIQRATKWSKLVGMGLDETVTTGGKNEPRTMNQRTHD